MPPVLARLSSSRHPAQLAALVLNLARTHVPRLLSHAYHDAPAGAPALGGSISAVRTHSFARRSEELGGTQKIVYALLIPVLVLLSGLFAGLTLGYMSLDETQLNVLSISGTEQQKRYANRIKPVRKNGHLLLVTLLLANMIVNETLPVIADPILGGGVQSVVVSTVLIVIFSEVIPQSVCTRYGLAVGATMAPFVKFLLYTVGILAWPVAKLLEIVLGQHHGIIYRRSELKELINIHAEVGAYGGDLKHDTVTIIGATLDLQEKVVQHAMTPVERVFMLPIDGVLDWETLRQICMTGHSRVPVYEWIEAPVGLPGQELRKERVKRIVGVLLVKQCVLLDPADATPLRKIPLNKVPTVPCNEPLLGMLDRFQEGRSHMAIVSRFSIERAQSVKKAVKKGLTQRLMNSVGIGESDSCSSSSSSDSDGDDTTEDGEKKSKKSKERKRKAKKPSKDALDVEAAPAPAGAPAKLASKPTSRRGSFQLPSVGGGGPAREQAMPADAVLARADAAALLQSFDPLVAPLGIITLEDVLEELIGEEILDEFDPENGARVMAHIPPHPPRASADASPPRLKSALKRNGSAPDLHAPPPRSEAASPKLKPRAPAQTASPPLPGALPAEKSRSGTSTPVLRPMALPLPALKSLSSLARFGPLSRSAPSTPRPKKAELAMPAPVAAESSERISEEREHPAAVPDDDIGVDADVEDEGMTAVQPPTPPIVAPAPLLHPSLLATAPSSPPSPGVEHRVEFLLPAESSTAAGAADASPVPASAVPSGLAPGTNTSRSASPAPSLEAFLLGGKRRVASAAAAGAAPGGAGGSAAERASSPAGAVLPKGTRFKSSPLNRQHSEAGIVIADHIMRRPKEAKDHLEETEKK